MAAPERDRDRDRDRERSDWRGLWALVFVVLVVVLAGGPARAGPPSDRVSAPTLNPAESYRARLLWQSATLLWPLIPVTHASPERDLAAGRSQRATLLETRQAPAGVRSVQGVVEIDHQRAAGVWLDALEIVRVRQLDGSSPVRMVRIVDDRAAIVEPGQPSGPCPDRGPEARCWELRQPPSGGALWSIESDSPARIRVERVLRRSPRYVAVELEHALLDWIASAGIATGPTAPALPTLLEPDDDRRSALALTTALAAALLTLDGRDRALERGVVAWRMLAAIAEGDHERATVRPYFAPSRARARSLALADTRPVALAVAESREYRRAPQPRRWTLDRAGPGQLEIAARAWAPDGQVLVAAELRVRVDGRILQRIPLLPRQARRASDPDAALPELALLRTEAGEPVGELARATVVLAPRRRDHPDYELELVGGPALIAVEASQRVESTAAAIQGRTPVKLGRALGRAIERSDAPARAWLELLATEQTHAPLPFGPADPRFDALAEAQPLLACVGLSIAARAPAIDGDAIARLVARVQPWLWALDADPQLDAGSRGLVRGRWLELIATHGRADLVPRVLGPAPGRTNHAVAELPITGLRTLATLITPATARQRSPVLALLEWARARAPADDQIRGQLLRAWVESSRWSRLRPRGLVDGAGADPVVVGEWLVDTRELDELDERAPVDARSPRYIGLAPSVATSIHVTLDDPERPRMRLLDLHVTTPTSSPDPTQLRVDDQRWWSPPLGLGQRYQVALGAGAHELELRGPPGTVIWAGPLRGAELEQLDGTVPVAERERLWSLAGSRWSIPGAPVPGFVRIQLRGLERAGAGPVWIRVLEDDGSPDTTARARTILFEPGADRDTEATPIVGDRWAGPRHELVIAIAADTRELRFEVEGGVEIAGAVALRRGLEARDFAELAGEAVEPQRAPRNDAPIEPQAALAALRGLDTEAALTEIESLSRTLLDRPQAVGLRARRAALLLWLGETGHARADLLELAISTDPAAAGWLEALDEHIDALTDPREVVVADAARAATPRLIEPAIAAVVGADATPLEPWLDAWDRARSGAVVEALAEVEAALELLGRVHVDPRDDPRDAARAGTLEHQRLLGALTRASLIERDREHPEQAARAWLDAYAQLPGSPAAVREPIAVALASVGPLLALLEDPAVDPEVDAALAYGLARLLEPVHGHGAVRRLRFVAGQRSDLQRLAHSHDNVGFEALELPVHTVEPGLSARVRTAVLAAPWSIASEHELLRPGRRAALRWEGQGSSVAVDLWCRATRPDLARTSPAPSIHGRLSLRRQGRAATRIERELELTLEDGHAELVELALAGPGTHQLELELDDDPIWSCAWRVQARASPTAEPEPIDARRRGHWWAAQPRQPVTWIVLGPTTIDVELRPVLEPTHPDARATTVALQVEQLDPGSGPRDPEPAPEIETGRLALPSRRDASVIPEGRRRFGVGEATTHTLVLTQPGPHRIELSSDRGRVLVRAERQVDHGGPAPPTRASLGSAPIAWLDSIDPIGADAFGRRAPASSPPIFAHDPIGPVDNRVGSLELRVRAGLDEIADVDDLRPRAGLVASVGWRRALIDHGLWLGLAGEVRLRDRSAPAGGGSLGIAARVPRVGVRLGADLEVLAERFGGQTETSVRLYSFLDRPTWIGAHLQLRPGVRAALRWQSLTPERVAAVTDPLEPHPRIYQRYIHDHPILLEPELELRGYPLQDLAVWTGARVIPNSDLRSLDHVDLEWGTVGIARRPRPWVPTWGVSYQLSPRFADEDRSSAFVRHRIQADLGLAVWARDTARVAMGVTNQLFVSNVAPVRDVLELWIRVDATWGRRLRDQGPREQWFTEPWAPQAWGDDEHQARSTYTPRER